MCRQLIALVVLGTLLGSAAEAQQLHVVILADDKAVDIGESVALDRKRVRRFFERGVRPDQLNLVEVAAEEMKSRRIGSVLGSLPIGGEDAVCVYYAGHGGIQNGGPYFQLAGVESSRISRSWIHGLIENRRVPPRFYALVSDCCGVIIDDTSALDDGRFSERQVVSETWGDPSTSALVTHLFLGEKGRVDINASRPGQVAIATKKRGGVFTRAFFETLMARRDEVLDWDHVFRLARERQSADFELVEEGLSRGIHEVAGIEQRTQTVFSFQPFCGRDLNEGRLGVQFDEGGVVSDVSPDSVAKQIGVVPGDLIMRINNRPIRSRREAILGLMMSGRNLELYVRNVQTGVGRDLTAELAW